VRYLTKGDNNSLDDRGLYAYGERWLSREEIIGRARMCVCSAGTFRCPPPPSPPLPMCRGVPYLGMVTILLNDYPYFKFVLLGVMGLYVLTSRDQ